MVIITPEYHLSNLKSDKYEANKPVRAKIFNLSEKSKEQSNKGGKIT